MPILTAEERVGTVLGGRYRLESILGSGGTATVYRALHTFTNRHVAVKLLNPERARDRDLVARFLKEARVASTIVHPHVVAILDMGTEDDCTYLAMELVLGESLAARVARDGPMSAEQAITLLGPLMEAISVAHDKGIVHRDVKPENVLVGDRGDGVERAVLLDFGMAKTNEVAWGSLTQSGVLVGTPYYMSPEQVEGAEDLGPETDVWSMGVLLYQVLSGELPFTGTNPTALLLAIARGQHAPLLTRAPTLPPGIAAWVEGALVTDRTKRYRTMREMRRALDLAISQGALRSGSTTSGIRSIEASLAADSSTLDEVPAPPLARAPWRRNVALGIAGITTLVALGLGISAMFSPSSEDPAARAFAAPVAPAETVVAALPVVPDPPPVTVAPASAPADDVVASVPSEVPPASAGGGHRRSRGGHARAEEAPSSEGGVVPTTTGNDHSGLVTEW